jgi:hypothetical protein
MPGAITASPKVDRPRRHLLPVKESPKVILHPLKLPMEKQSPEHADRIEMATDFCSFPIMHLKAEGRAEAPRETIKQI